MFRNISTFNAAGSNFQHAGGDQINFESPPPRMVGLADPQSQQLLSVQTNSSPNLRRSPAAPMFGRIKRFKADHNDLRTVRGNQIDYRLSHAAASTPITIYVPANQNILSPSFSSTPLPEVTMSEAEARMFRNKMNADHTLEEVQVGQQFAPTRESIRQIEAKMRTLRHPSRAELLKGFQVGF